MKHMRAMSSHSTCRRLWRAVLSRDARMDGAFVYAVRSTGVYCRPSCPSRRPHAARLYSFAPQARRSQHGFRACRRCWAQQAARAAEFGLVAACAAFLEQAGCGCSDARKRPHASRPAHGISAEPPAASVPARHGRHAARLCRPGAPASPEDIACARRKM